MMTRMRRRLKYIGIILLFICIFTGCGNVEQSTVTGGGETDASQKASDKVLQLVDEAIAGANDAVTNIKLAMQAQKDLLETEVIEVPESIPVLAPAPVVGGTTAPETAPVPGTVIPEPIPGTTVPEAAPVLDPAAGEALPPEYYEFTQSDESYFADALFIGDSRTVGLQMYGYLSNADYFATPGLSVYSLPRTKLTVGERKDVKLTELLEQKEYKKIYLMLGINELGYNFEKTVSKYKELVTQLQQQEPGAVIYVCANLHVTALRDENDKTHNNANIDRINAEIAALEDKKNIFYLDINELFDDANGDLGKEYASDDTHVSGEYYEEWCVWLQQHTIVK